MSSVLRHDRHRLLLGPSYEGEVARRFLVLIPIGVDPETVDFSGFSYERLEISVAPSKTDAFTDVHTSCPVRVFFSVIPIATTIIVEVLISIGVGRDVDFLSDGRGDVKEFDVFIRHIEGSPIRMLHVSHVSVVGCILEAPMVVFG